VEAPFRNRSAPKFGEFVDLTDVITPAKFGSKIFIGFSRLRGRKTHFPFGNQTAYISQAARQGLAVLMASAVVVLKHETSTFAKGTILYQLI